MPYRHGKLTRVLIDDQDLSGYFRELAVTWDADTPETTTFLAPNKTFIMGIDNGSVSLAGLFDGSTGAVDAKLATILGVDPGPIVLAGIEGSGLGRRVRLFAMLESSYNITNPVADVVNLTATLVPQGPIAAGIFLNDMAVPISAAGNGTMQDNAVSTNTGAVAHLHVVANTWGNAATIKVQHSTDNITYVDLVTFANVPANTTAKERQVIASGVTINRYTRYTIAGTPAGGSMTAAVAFGRT